MKHTPGPWTVQFPTSDDPELAIVGGGRVLADMFGVSGNQPDNARLIALAPTLADALRRLADRVEQIELPDGSTPDTLEARSLLAKLEEE